MSTQLSQPYDFYCSSLELCDFDSVVEIEPQCYSNPWSREVLYNEFSKDVSLRLALRSKREEGRPVGYCFNHLVIDELHVLNLAIAPAYQSQGLGALLLEETLQEGIVRGARRAFLEVRPSNARAVALYQHFGFQRLGIRKCYYRDNGEDAILMEALLPPA